MLFSVYLKQENINSGKLMKNYFISAVGYCIKVYPVFSRLRFNNKRGIIMLKKFFITVSAFAVLYGCTSAPMKAPLAKSEVEKKKTSGCDKYLVPGSEIKGGCAEGDCNEGAGVFVYDNGDCYDGENKNNVRHGEGIMFYKNWGEKYDGSWVNDNRVGSGTLTFNNGDTYSGDFKLNVPWGIGIYRYADGSVEEGEFFDYLFVDAIKLPGLTDEDKVEIGKVVKVDSPAGEVSVAGSNLAAGDKLFVEINGLMAALVVLEPVSDTPRCRMIGGTRMLISKVYKGMTVFKLMPGIKRGNNTFLFPNGNRYIGEYKGNRMDQKGEFYWTNGNVYKGEFKNGVRHGKGVLTFYNGASYSGDWKNGYMEGSGVYTWSNGNRYTGDFQKGFREGHATFVWANGDTYTGGFKKDLMDGHGEYRAVNGESYSGDYRDDMKEGQGTYIWSSGDKYIGEWKKNLQDGDGTYIWSDGGRYVGQWKDHKMHGKGVEYDYDGKIIREGLWDNGNYIGEGI